MHPQRALDISPLALMTGESPAMKQVARLIPRLGKSRFPVLILGETGTGKEVAARAIHQVEARGPFVVIDCSSLVGPLMESELFGYAKGAFTGAHTSKLGLLDSANNGTAFFDEIGELPLDLQMKLLRVLQEKEFRAVGGVGQRSSDFRVIAATNRDLAAEVKAGRFRQDLFYRLNVMKLRLPPLRERRQDIPLLVKRFVERYGNGHQMAGDAMEQLMQWDWPGNVRELEHTIQQMVAMNSGPWITSADMPSTVVNAARQAEFAAAQNETPGLFPPASSPSLQTPGAFTAPVLPLEEVERRAIFQAIQYTKGDRTVAAALLQIGRTTLYRKLKQYGLQE